MSMMERARNVVLASRERIERATGKVLGDEDMPVKEQVEELMVQIKTAGDKVIRSTGKVLGDEDMPVKVQLEQIKSHVRAAAKRFRDSLKKGERPRGS